MKEKRKIEKKEKIAIAGYFRGLQFSWIGRFWIFVVNILVVVLYPSPNPVV